MARSNTARSELLRCNWMHLLDTCGRDDYVDVVGLWLLLADDVAARDHDRLVVPSPNVKPAGASAASSRIDVAWSAIQ